jgi:hypothetical protein
VKYNVWIDGIERSGMERNKMEWSGTEWNGVEQNGMEQIYHSIVWVFIIKFHSIRYMHPKLEGKENRRIRWYEME